MLEVGETAAAEPAPGEMRVRVALSGVNPGDTKKRADWPGPTWLNDLTIAFASPALRRYWPQTTSIAALLAAYGLSGRAGRSSVIGSSSAKTSP